MQDGPVPALKAQDSRTGTVLAHRYRLEQLLGAGGMGEVYAAKHLEIPRRFAVKLLRAEFARDREMQQRFRREAEAAAGLVSDHIVEISDFGYAADNSPFLVMELLEGLDLRRVLNAASKLPVGQAVAIVTQACAGVASAHEKGIIHRDLKPENLFLARRANRTTVKVLDFGIAKLRNQSLDTGAGRLLGTPAYMPPEQVRSDAGIDQRADVYALGVILYEALTGALPHPGAGQHEIITHVLFGEPAWVRALNQAIPEELAQIVHRALARAAEARFASVAELALALAPFVGSEALSLPAAADGELRPTLPAQSSEVRPAPPSARDDGAEFGNGGERVRRRRAPARTLVLALAALVLGALIWSWRAPRAGHRPLSARAPRVTSDVDVSTAVAPSTRAAAALAPSAASAAVAVVPPAATTEPQAAGALGGSAIGPTHPPAVRMRARAVRDPAASAGVARRAATLEGSANAPAAPRPETETATIEVRRGERTIVFKRDNPLRSK